MKLLDPISLLATLTTLTCQPVDSRAGDPATQHPGARIVENARPPEGSRLGWRIGPEPTVSIGVMDGEDPYVFGSAPDATRLSDGRIVVVEAGSAELRVFDGRSGTHLATWAGRGDGPGEVAELGHVAPLPGDSIIAWSYLRSMTVFDLDGNFVRTSYMKRLAETSAGPRPPSPVAVLDDGSLLASVSLESLDTVVVEVWDVEGNLKGRLGAHLQHAPRISNEFWRFETFGWNMKLAPWGELAIVTPSDRYEIRAYATDGTLARIVRMEHERRSPTAAHVKAYIEARVSEARAPRRARRHHQAAPVAEYFPAFASVMADRLGHLWVEEFAAPGEEEDGVLWTVFDPAGYVLGLVETPKGLEIYEIGADYILGRVRNELGMQSIQLWSLERVESHAS